MVRLGVVVNPTANSNRARGTGGAVLRELSALGHDVVDLSADTADAALVGARAACAAADDRIDALVVVGGDGMVHLGVNAVAGTEIPLGLVAIGSGNDFARTVRLPVHDGRAALQLLQTALENGPRPIDVLRSEPLGGGEPVRTACVLSAGVDAAVNARANGYSFPPGGGKYIRGVLAELAGFRPYGYRVTTDGDRRDLVGTLIAVANGPYLGGGMKIAPDARLDDGLADVVIAEGLTPWQVVRLFPRIYSGSHVDHPAVRVVRAHEVLLEAWAPHPAPPEAFGDGERIGSLPLRVTVEAGGVQLLAPAVP